MNLPREVSARRAVAEKSGAAQVNLGRALQAPARRIRLTPAIGCGSPDGKKSAGALACKLDHVQDRSGDKVAILEQLIGPPATRPRYFFVSGGFGVPDSADDSDDID